MGKKFGRRWWRLVRSLLQSKDERSRPSAARARTLARSLARPRVGRVRLGEDDAIV